MDGEQWRMCLSNVAGVRHLNEEKTGGITGGLCDSRRGDRSSDYSPDNITLQQVSTGFNTSAPKAGKSIC
jgi:hypothetical protein